RGVFVWDWDGWVDGFLGMARRSAIRTLPVPPPHLMVSVAGGSPVHMSNAIARTFSSPDRVIVRVPATEPFETIVARVEDAQPHILQGYPSMLHRLALEATSGRLSISPVEILAGSEVLSEETRALLTDVWGAPVGDLYATTDVGPIASSCDHGTLHLCDDLVIVEVVDQHGDPVPDGTEGDHLIVTGLVNHALPLLRYELDDRVTISSEACPCGSAHRSLRSVGGRTPDVFTFGDATVHPVTLSGALAGDRRIADWRAIRVPSGLAVDVVAVDVDRLDVRDVQERLRSRLARAGVRLDEVIVQVRVVPVIDRPASGKVRRYVTATEG
ncbi:MAG TPA: hypothetical protein VM933_02260, partial [Acidimicrobiales bacterium]|nr:hypothetical protein [Acidimicrobiales bacterium]